MKESYKPKKIEKFVQNYWKKNNIFKTTEDKNKKKFYCLVMLPYPSGKLHMGHVRNYTIGDVIARYQRMLGKNVLHPMGWDAFGLPAEIAAIENKIHPEEWTKKNIEYMKEQLTQLGYSYDWSREINTSKPEYYKWEQWLFTILYKKKLTYKKKSIVNWCPNDKTVLANEQVIDNKCWRCNTLVQKKKIYQWFLKITKYAEQLLNDLSLLKKWPKEVKKMQKNWIGKKEIIEISIPLLNKNKKIKVYTKRLDTIMGATYIAVSKNHWIATKLKNENKKNVNFFLFLKKTKKKETNNVNIDNYGIKTEELAIHPFTKKKIPIWIVNFIKENKNKKINAFICTPAHNLKEWNFAIKNNIPIIQVIKNNKNKNNSIVLKKGELFNSKKFNGLSSEKSYEKIFQELIKKKIAKKKYIFKIKDWGVSRQRYWGTPIPMYTNKNGKILSVPEKYLPIILPKINNKNKENKKNIFFLEKNRKILIEGEKVKIEKDTFDTFIESSWYYARYTSPKFKKGIFDLQAAKYWLPIDQYIGGIEHATMHLIYLRFFHKLLRDIGLVNSDEPVKNLLCQGMVLSNSFYYKKKDGTIKWLPKELILVKKNKKEKTKNYFLNNGQKIINAGMTKMSKSKKNGIDPKTMIEKYGADTIRLFIMFSAPVEASLEWNESGVIGSYRFIKKLWKIVQKYKNNENNHINFTTKKIKNNDFQEEIKQKVNSTIKQVTNDIEKRKSFNTAISKIMKLVNELSKYNIENEKDKSTFYKILLSIIKMMYPFIPHVCFVLWKSLTGKYNIDYASWPKNNCLKTKKIINLKIIIVIQINSKIREKIKLKKNISEEEIINIAKKSKNIKKYLKEKKIKKIIYIKNKLLNFVI
ncbi:Leucine--tRNA ligase [Buchnera aphidicola (Tetraneura ulmi)]